MEETYAEKENYESPLIETYDLRIVRYIIDHFLSPLDRVIILFFLEGLSDQEISNKLKIKRRILCYHKLTAFNRIRQIYETKQIPKRCYYETKFTKRGNGFFDIEPVEAWISASFKRTE